MTDGLSRWWIAAGAVFAAALIALAGYALIVGRAAPQMSGVVSAGCAAGPFSFRAHAYYRSEGGRWKIHKMLYRIRGGGHDVPRGLAENLGLSPYVRGLYNNVAVKVVSDGEWVYSLRSPDSRIREVLYRQTLTADTGRRKPTHVVFEVDFDFANTVDPHCEARTPMLPLS